MGVKQRPIFGIHSITPRHRTTLLPYGILEVLGGANLEMSGESEDLFGGSSKFAYASEPTQISASCTMNVKSYPNFLMELFMGGSTTSISAAANGEIRGFANKKGTSVSNGVTGIDAVELASGDKADLKFGKYIIVALDATHVDVYAVTNIDFNRGTKVDFLNDALKVASNVTVTSGGDTAIADFGIQLAGGSGTIAFVTGDIAEFEVLPPHSGASKILIGSATAEFPAFNAVMLASKNSSKQIFQIEAFNVVGSGMPMPLQEKAFMVSDLSLKLLRDATRDAVMEITFIEEVE